MNVNDFEKFSEIWQLAHEVSVNGKVISDAAISGIFEDLMMFDINDIVLALKKHRRISKFSPTTHDIVKILEENKPVHLSADEAWAIVLKSFDESETVVMTDEMMHARAFAIGVWDHGDKVGARMAFKGAYEREVSVGRKPVWRVSLGHDKERRDIVISSAVERGFLPRSDLAKHGITDNREPSISIARLVDMSADKSTQSDKENILSRLHKLKSGMQIGFDREEIEQLSARIN